MRILSAPNALVLMYHRVVDLGRDPFWLHVAPSDFSDHLRVLAETCDVVPLAEITRPSSARRRVAITFDDGYDDNLAVAAPALHAAGFPATVFIVSDLLEGTERFWWDRLEHLVLDAADDHVVQVDLGDGAVRIDLRDARRRDRALSWLAGRLRPLPRHRQDAVLVDLAQQVGMTSTNCPCHAHLDRDGIERLARSPGISIGAHTRSHACLASAPPEAQLAEIAGSVRALEVALDQPVRTFAYPYGSHDSWDSTSVRAARRAGIELAVTTVTGDVSRSTPRLRVPRIAVRGWSGDEFAANLELWFRGGRTL